MEGLSAERERFAGSSSSQECSNPSSCRNRFSRPPPRRMKGMMRTSRWPRPHSECGKETADKLRDVSLKLYLAGREYARQRGIIIADTKFEFGVVDGEICVVDEVLTPDSSRFWPADQYAPGRDQPSFDKQIVRNYLTRIGWDKTPPGPELPLEIASQTTTAYHEIYERLTR